MTPSPRFSIIIPVYNRPDEIDDLLRSLESQTLKNFEVIIAEDGSTIPCRQVVERHSESGFPIKYYYKDNEGRSIARNYAMQRAVGDYFIFFDSDCVVPPSYFETVTRHLSANPVNCFGGPDAAHQSFSDIQKAISFAMTSFLTTGGIRGGRLSMERFTPRTFNMGFSRNVYDKVGGFREMFSEDIDMSKRIEAAGFKCVLLHDAAVFHKRRVNFRKFFRQVYVFGMSRITLHLLYPGSLKAVHALPALFVVGMAALIVMSVFLSPLWLIPAFVYAFMILVAALLSTKSPKVSVLAVPASFIQLTGYGAGFIRAFVSKIILRRKRNINEEIALRKGK